MQAAVALSQQQQQQVNDERKLAEPEIRSVATKSHLLIAVTAVDHSLSDPHICISITLCLLTFEMFISLSISYDYVII